MSESNPAIFLFTPPSSPRLVVPTPSVDSTSSSCQFYIVPPSLPSDEMKLYETGLLAFPADFSAKDIDKIIGEGRETTKLHYYVRFRDGITHKFLARAFNATYNDFVRDYEQEKEEGRLEPFEPSAYYVHPSSRPTVAADFQKGPPIRVASLSASSGGYSESDETDESFDSQSEEQESDGNDSDSDGSMVLRRSTRFEKKRRVKILPFSPRTRRFRYVHASDDSDDAYSSTASKVQKKKRNVVRGKASRPAYGRFRVVADLEYDEISDEETAPLRVHRGVCEKCHRKPAHELLEMERKKPTKKLKKKKEDEFADSGDEEEKVTALGGWVRCLKCPVSAHWRCLASTQRDEILRAAREVDKALWQATHLQSEHEAGAGTAAKSKEPGKRVGLDAYQTTEFICGACMKGGICLGCMEVAREPDDTLERKLAAPAGDSTPSVVAGKETDVEMADGTQAAVFPSDTRLADEGTSVHELLFRCFTCKRLGHYRCLPTPAEPVAPVDAVSAAKYYQTVNGWLCADCFSYNYRLDQILAWRPYPPNAIEPPRPADEPPSHKIPLPREYLVKWMDRSYRRTQWVPHMWLTSTNAAKLKNFLATGPKVELLLEAASEDAAIDLGGEITPTFEIGADGGDINGRTQTKVPALPSDPSLDAELKIPPAWKTVDRVLDVLLWTTHKQAAKGNNNRRKSQGRGEKKADDDDNANVDDGVDENTQDEEDSIEKERAAAFNEGEQPPDDLTETVEEWEKRTKNKLQTEHIKYVVWAFIKWGDLAYDQASWDSPPRPGEFGYSAFEIAFSRFIDSRSVIVPKRTHKEEKAFDNRAKGEYARKYVLKDDEQPMLGQKDHLKLMPFQIDGFNWLCNNWWTRQHCILADEMGLGKTVQIATFLGSIIKNFDAFPALVVVPNSTITNWVREFERWSPGLRVVPFFGEAQARDVIKNFELNHGKKANGTTGAKFHVLVTTYETITNPKDFHSVFRSQPRWEVLVVDEGQRLKNDSNMLFKKLNELNSIHRVIMTGTPLNNNMRELFNLMNFLDPTEWHDLEGLEKEHEELTEELVKQLHNRLKPYFLRRIKSEVLQLPPKNEVIVPVSMAPLQKEIYRSILSHNVHILKGLAQPSNPKAASTVNKANLNNMLMQLRKCLQHPYLYSEDIEPRGLSPQETHEKLIDASAKLRLLKTLLPKLKARGHRVLLFSQFVIALDVIEDFLVGEGITFLRLDGTTKQVDRQKGMDEFNQPGSEIFIYLLTTRAGGVGINLWSADTVIIFDPDFNPHQDLQAIARAHRYGQTKTCLVFKLMVKDSAEERIVQTGKKKLILDHLIIQKIDDDDSFGDNVQSILTYGAQALFDEEQGARDIIYTDNDIEKLIDKTETEGDQVETIKEAGMTFAFAKIWAADKDSLEEVADDLPDDQGDSWAQTLQRIASKGQDIQVQEATGRGVRRRAAAPIPQQELDLDDIPKAKSRSRSQKRKSKSKSASEESAYSGSVAGSNGEESDNASSLGEVEVADLTGKRPVKKTHRREIPPISLPPSGPSIPVIRYRAFDPNNAYPSQVTSSSNSGHQQFCGLCEMRHGEGDCSMTKSSKNLAEFRQMLISHSDDEPVEVRLAAIKAIDDALRERGRFDLISGQPIRVVPRPSKVLPKKKVKGTDLDGNVDSMPQSSTGSVSKMTDGHVVPGRNTSQQTATLSVLAAQSQASTSRNGNTQKSPKIILVHPLDFASAPKRTSPFTDSSSSKKRPKPSVDLTCVVCGRTPHHLIKDCPVVAEGPKSVSTQIKRLGKDPSLSSTVQILRKILSKQKKKEFEEQPQATPCE